MLTREGENMNAFAAHVENELRRWTSAHDMRTLLRALSRDNDNRPHVEYHLCLSMAARDEGRHDDADKALGKALGIARYWTGERVVSQ